MKTQVNGNLVIARASRMQPRARSSNHPSQLGLDCHMDVFIVDIEYERAVVYTLLYSLKALMNSIRIVGGNNSLGGKHAGMGLRTRNVLCIHLFVHKERCPEFLREFVHAPLEPSRPQRHDAHLSVESELPCNPDENPPCALRGKASTRRALPLLLSGADGVCLFLLERALLGHLLSCKALLCRPYGSG